MHGASAPARGRAARWGGRLLFAVLCVGGAAAGALLLGRTSTDIGPFHTTVSLRASLAGDTRIALPPLGTLTLETHDGPFGLTIRADEVDAAAARAVVDNPSVLRGYDDDAVSDARGAVRSVVWRAAVGALLGALVVGGLRAPRPLPLGAAALTAAVLVATSAVTARATWNDNALAEPRYSGLLAAAPQAIGSVERVRRQYDAYRSQVAALVGNVAELYNTTAALQSFEPTEDTVRVLHVSDIHLNPQAFDVIDQLVRQFGIDAVVDTGDINDWGTEAEGGFVGRIGQLKVPYVYVRGNHDSAATARSVAAQPNAVVLEGEARQVSGLRFWGIPDPRFTPDKSEEIDRDEQAAVAAHWAPRVARQVRRATRQGGTVDVVALHDPRLAADLGGVTPLVIAGHTHRRGTRTLGRDTLVLVEGSTGGAGLRTLERGEAMPLSCSVLYFDRADGSLRAYDRITVAGLGGAGARIERHVLPDATAASSASTSSTSTSSTSTSSTSTSSTSTSEPAPRPAG